MGEVPTRAEWERMTPMEQGFCSYMYGNLPGNDVPEEWQCPYEVGTEKYRQFVEGSQRAALVAQDSED